MGSNIPLGRGVWETRLRILLNEDTAGDAQLINCTYTLHVDALCNVYIVGTMLYIVAEAKMTMQ